VLRVGDASPVLPGSKAHSVAQPECPLFGSSPEEVLPGGGAARCLVVCILCTAACQPEVFKHFVVVATYSPKSLLLLPKMASLGEGAFRSGLVVGARSNGLQGRSLSECPRPPPQLWQVPSQGTC
jgi:hypothetical protein